MNLKRQYLPMILILLGAWLMAGCFYLPVLEHATDKNQTDFRKLVGHDKSNRPIRERIVTRERVRELLGSPAYASADQRAIGYAYITERGAWVYPLCFTATPGTERLYILRLIFDEHDMLQRWDIEHEDGDHPMLIDNGAYWKGTALQKLNKSGPALMPLSGSTPRARMLEGIPKPD